MRHRATLGLIFAGAACGAPLICGCRGAVPTTFTVTSAQSGQPIQGATIELNQAQRRVSRSSNRTFVTDASGQATATVAQWPFIRYEVDVAGYDRYRLGVYERLQQWDARSIPIVMGADIDGESGESSQWFSAVRPQSGATHAYEFALQWDERPTIVVELPAGFTGILILAKEPGPAELPASPEPRVFRVETGQSNVAAIPSWDRAEVPFVHYRFVRAGQRLPPYRRAPGGESARVLRDMDDAVLAFVGDEQTLGVVRQIFWNEDFLDIRFEWDEPAFESVRAMLESAGRPMTVDEIAGGLSADL